MSTTIRPDLSKSYIITAPPLADGSCACGVCGATFTVHRGQPLRWLAGKPICGKHDSASIQPQNRTGLRPSRLSVPAELRDKVTKL